MNILAGYIIIAFLSFLGFNLYDFIDFNLNFSFKKAIKHPFSFLYCFLYEGIKAGDLNAESKNCYRTLEQNIYFCN